MKRGIKIPKKAVKPPRPSTPEDTVLDQRKDEAVIGDRVVFGRAGASAEKTLGRVVGITSGDKLKVEQLEARGRTKAHKIGTVWTVARSLCRVVNDEEAVPVQVGVTGQQRAVNNRNPVTGMPVVNEPVNITPAFDEAGWHVMQAITIVYRNLEEDFDGEGAVNNILAWRRAENAKLRHLCRAIGRHVTPEQAEEWAKQYALAGV